MPREIDNNYGFCKYAIYFRKGRYFPREGERPPYISYEGII